MESGKGNRRDFETLSTLGKGSQGIVKLARHIPTQTLVAIKSIPKPQRTEPRSQSPTMSSASSSGGAGIARISSGFDAAREQVLVEAAILVQMDGHGGVPRFYELFDTQNSWKIVQEYIPGPVSIVPAHCFCVP
jgi:serine/threonine protein kinase